MTKSRTFVMLLLSIAAAIILGAFLGLVSVSMTRLIIFLSVVGATLFAVACFTRPFLSVAIFWILYALQTTVFAGKLNYQGLFYPLYFFMGVNGVRHLIQKGWKKSKEDYYVHYMAFLLIVVAGLMWQPAGLTVDTEQRLVIYVLGILVSFQFWGKKDAARLIGIITVAGLAISIWVIFSSLAMGFAYRGGVKVNPNYVSLIIGLGMVPLVSRLADHSGLKPFQRLGAAIGLATGLYATLLLASRGMAVSFLVAALAVVSVNARSARDLVTPVIIIILSGILLSALPGSQNLAGRLSEAGISNFNGRIPIWLSGLQQVVSSSPRAFLLGAGLGSSELVVRNINAALRSMHNTYFQVLLEYGILGLIAFLWLLVVLLVRCVRSRNSILVGLLAYVSVGCMVATLADNYLFWIVAGIAMSYTTREEPIREAPTYDLNVNTGSV